MASDFIICEVISLVEIERVLTQEKIIHCAVNKIDIPEFILTQITVVLMMTIYRLFKVFFPEHLGFRSFIHFFSQTCEVA